MRYRRKACAFGSSLLLGVLIVGCASDGPLLEPEMPRSLVESAVIRTELDLGSDKISITRIDGRSDSLLDYRWVVAPGSHEVEVEADLPEPHRPGFRAKVTRTLPVTVSAGGQYYVRAASDSNGVWIWIEDSAEKRVVAGEPPRPKR